MICPACTVWPALTAMEDMCEDMVVMPSAMLDGNMVAGPVTGVAGVEHDPRPSRRESVCRVRRGNQFRCDSGPTAVLAEVGTDDAPVQAKHRRYPAAPSSATTAARAAIAAVPFSAYLVCEDRPTIRRTLGGLPPAFAAARAAIARRRFSAAIGSRLATRPVTTLSSFCCAYRWPLSAAWLDLV